MKHIKIDKETFNRINDYYLEICGSLTDYKVDKDLKLRSYNLFEILYNQLYYRNTNKDYIPQEEIDWLASFHSVVNTIEPYRLVKLTPEEYKEIIYLAPKKADKEDCKGNVRGNKILDDGTILKKADYLDKAIWEAIDKFEIICGVSRNNELVGLKEKMLPFMLRVYSKNTFYLAFSKYSADKLLELSKNYGKQFVLDKLKLDSVYAKNLYSYICRNYRTILEGHYYNPTTRQYTNGEYIGEEVDKLIKILRLENYSKNNAINEVEKAVNKINEILDFGLNVEFPKDGVEGKTSEIKKIKFTLKDNGERDLKYIGHYKRKKPKYEKNTRNDSYKITSPPRGKQEKTPEKLSKKKY